MDDFESLSHPKWECKYHYCPEKTSGAPVIAGVSALSIVGNARAPCGPLRSASSVRERGRMFVQIRSGNLMMKLSRFGILTLGNVCAFIGSSSGMSLLPASR